jgi:hypothetical protein
MSDTKIKYLVLCRLAARVNVVQFGSKFNAFDLYFGGGRFKSRL